MSLDLVLNFVFCLGTGGFVMVSVYRLQAKLNLAHWPDHWYGTLLVSTIFACFVLLMQLDFYGLNLLVPIYNRVLDLLPF
ncbi:hypothetical protein [Sulfitobacter sp. 20_GPM-1509m]|uniref:hypothetical protein n=1 Tax=Sulfitobacter sp. 20_GPM-1509m TaxID=1380367 RepID=UPI00048E4FC4|nr:hypothetical protein [Sulfitobacter sp. 20_GPM-1509m]